MRPEFRAVLLGLALAATGVAQAAPPDDYAYAFPLQIPAEHAAVRVDLTPEVYAASRREAGLGDIVVVNAEGGVVPFAPLPEAPTIAHPYELSTRLLPVPATAENPTGVRVERTAAGDIVIDPGHATGTVAKPSVWLIDARREIHLDSLELPNLPDVDTEIHVAIDASNDLQHWNERNDDAVIVSVKRGEDGVDLRKITVDGEPARYYRMRLTQGAVGWDGTNAPDVHLVGSFTDAEADRNAARRWITLEPTASAAANGGTDYDYRLPAVLPIEAARVELADTNTAARFELLAADEGTPKPSWSSLAAITAIHVGSGKPDEATTFSAPVRRQSLRLHTTTPLAQSPKLVVAWRPDAFVFLGEGTAPYRLLVGSYAARRADYPMDSAIDALRAQNSADWLPATSTIGPRVDAAGPSLLEAPKVPYDWTRPLLWLVLIGGALLVGGMAFSLLRQSKADNSQP
jgi:hypothetical protein